ncbi:MAG TPA: energy transducer TonB [Lacunisphaera sp.]|nr:energy transducer TonB [Lacunisphaera sp.]
MANADTLLPPESFAANLMAEVLSFVLGASLTVALFFGVAHFAATEAPAEEEDIAELRAMSVPLEAPPPRPQETPPVVQAVTPFAGLEVSSADSPVQIAVVPPDLSQLLPVSTHAPAARIEPAQLYTEFKPRTEMGADFSRIFQQHEVDQRPVVVSRPKPYVAPVVRGNVDTLRISVLILIDTNGTVSSVRVLQASGNEHFDKIILHDIRHAWIFSPAMKKGRKVRCLVQQNVRVVWQGGSPFDSY